MKKVIAFSSPNLLGGVGTVIRDLSRAFRLKGRDTAFVSFCDKYEPFSDWFSTGVWKPTPAGISRFYLQSRKGKIEALILSSGIVNYRKIKLLIAMLKKHTCIIVTHHGSTFFDASQLRGCVITAVSEDAARAIRIDDSMKVRVIPNGIDIECQCDLSFEEIDDVVSDQRVPLIWIGRTGGCDVLEKDPYGFAYFACSAIGSKYQCVLVDGEPPEMDNLEKSWLDNILKYKYKLSQPSIRGLLHIAGARGGALIMTSKSEGFPMVVLEAFTQRCPAIVPNVPGLGHVKDGKNGLVYEKRNIHSIWQKVLQLEDKSFQQQIKEKAYREVIEKYNISIVSELYLQTIGEAVRNE